MKTGAKPKVKSGAKPKGKEAAEKAKAKPKPKTRRQLLEELLAEEVEAADDEEKTDGADKAATKDRHIVFTSLAVVATGYIASDGKNETIASLFPKTFGCPQSVYNPIGISKLETIVSVYLETTRRVCHPSQKYSIVSSGCARIGIHSGIDNVLCARLLLACTSS